MFTCETIKDKSSAYLDSVDSYLVQQNNSGVSLLVITWPHQNHQYIMSAVSQRNFAYESSSSTD